MKEDDKALVWMAFIIFMFGSFIGLLIGNLRWAG